MTQEKLFRWVKASERLPEPQGWYFVQIAETKECWMGMHMAAQFEAYKKHQPEKAELLEWLEEVELPSSPLPTEEEVQEAGNDYAAIMIWIDKGSNPEDSTPEIVEFHEYISEKSFIAGAKWMIEKQNDNKLKK